MSKVFKDDEKTEWTIVKAVIGLCAVLFIVFGFMVKSECGIDKVNLWCRLHPFSIGDFIGTILFLGGLFMLSGLWKKWFTLWEDENTTRWNWIIFGGTALGIILIWNT